MYKLSSIISKPIFSLFEGMWLGTITDVCLNAGKIKGFFVLHSDEENISFISKKDIYKIGEGAIFVKNVSKLSFAICEKLNLINKKAITIEGVDLGNINEVFFDEKFYVLSVQTNFGVLLPYEKIVNIGEDSVIFSLLENKIKISSFKPKSNLFKKEVPDIKVSIMEETQPKIFTSELISIGEVKSETILGNKSVTIPKKIMQNPNFLIGRTASNSIRTESGEVIIKEGQTITEKTISRAKIYNKIFELSSCANWNLFHFSFWQVCKLAFFDIYFLSKKYALPKLVWYNSTI